MMMMAAFQALPFAARSNSWAPRRSLISLMWALDRLSHAFAEFLGLA
jgi:hypothetical protein